MTNSRTPTISSPARRGVARIVTVLKPVCLSASDQKEPSLETSATAMGCPVEKTRPAMPLPGGILTCMSLSRTSLKATRNLRPPSFPSRTNTEAWSEPTACAVMRSRFSMEFVSGAVKELATSTALTAAFSLASNESPFLAGREARLPCDARFFAAVFFLVLLAISFQLLLSRRCLKQLLSHVAVRDYTVAFEDIQFPDAASRFGLSVPAKPGAQASLPALSAYWREPFVRLLAQSCRQGCLRSQLKPYVENRSNSKGNLSTSGVAPAC